MRALLVAVLAALVLPSAALAAPGDLDTSFDGDGKLLLPFGAADSAALDMDASTEDIALAGYADSDADGVIEALFSLRTPTGVAVTTQFTELAHSARFTSVARRPGNAGFVAAGWTEDGAGGSDMIVARFAHDGQIVSSFGGAGNGVATIDLGPGDAKAHAVTVDGDGRIYVAGAEDEGAMATARWIVTRLDDSGAPDAGGAGFGGAGQSSAVLPNADPLRDAVPKAIAFVGNGFVVAGGENQGIDHGAYRVDRLTTAGIVDGSFGGGDGHATVEHDGGFGFFNAIVQLQDGSFVAGGGRSSTSGDRRDWHLTKLSPAGAALASPSFQRGTFAEITDLTIEGGSVIAAGYVDSDFGIGRFAAATLAPDQGFHFASTDFGNTQTPISFDYTTAGDVPSAISVIGGDRILLAGAGSTSHRKVALARYRLDGGSTSTGNSTTTTATTTTTHTGVGDTPALPPAVVREVPAPVGGSAGLSEARPLPQSDPVFASFVRTPPLTLAQASEQISGLRGRGAYINVAFDAVGWDELPADRRGKAKPNEIVAEQTLAPGHQGMRTTPTAPMLLRLSFYNPLENCGKDYATYKAAIRKANGANLKKLWSITDEPRFVACRWRYKPAYKSSYAGKKLTETLVTGSSVVSDGQGKLLEIDVVVPKNDDPPKPSCPTDKIRSAIINQRWDGGGAETYVRNERGKNPACAFDVQFRNAPGAPLPYRYVMDVKGRTITVGEPRSSLVVWVGTHGGGADRLPLLPGWQLLSGQMHTLNLKATDIGMTVGPEGRRNEHLSGVVFDVYFDPAGPRKAEDLGHATSDFEGDAAVNIVVPDEPGTVRVEASWGETDDRAGLGGFTTMKVITEKKSGCVDTMTGYKYTRGPHGRYVNSTFRANGTPVYTQCARGQSAGDPDAQQHLVEQWEAMTGRKLAAKVGGQSINMATKLGPLIRGDVTLWQGAIGTPLVAEPVPPKVVGGSVYVSTGHTARASYLQDFGPTGTALVFGDRTSSIRGGYLGLVKYVIGYGQRRAITPATGRVVQVGNAKTVLPEGGGYVVPATPGTQVVSGTVNSDPLATDAQGRPKPVDDPLAMCFDLSQCGS